MTPAEHKTEAEDSLTALAAGPTGHALTANDADALALAAHAHLAQALGTGDHYTTADDTLATFAARRAAGASMTEQVRLARVAHSHAVLADR